MDNEVELQNYKDRIERIADQFVEYAGDFHLSPDDIAHFKRSVLEVSDLLRDIFGENNYYIQEIERTIDALSVQYDRSPKVECVKQVAAVIGAAHTQYKRKKLSRSNSREIGHSVNFVDDSRIAELKSIGKERYDLTRLIRLCEELNRARENNCYLSMAMLMRAIIDHIPPIFGANKFLDVASNYKGAKSFKESMTHLESSLRKIADSHLHVQIRKQEILPTYPQVNFSADLDVLLAEIVRILK